MKKSLIERFQKLAGIKSVNKLTEQPIPDKDRDDSIYTDPNPDRPGYVRPTGLDKPGSDDIEDPRPDPTSPIRRMCCPSTFTTYVVITDVTFPVTQTGTYLGHPDGFECDASFELGGPFPGPIPVTYSNGMITDLVPCKE